MVLLPVRGGGPDTKLQSRCNAACHVVGLTVALVRLPLSQEMVSLSSCDVGRVCSKRQVGWRGRDKETA